MNIARLAAFDECLHHRACSLRPMAGITEHVTLLGLRLRGWRRRHVATSVGRVHLLDVRGHGTLPTPAFLHGLSSAGSHYGSLLVRVRPFVRRVIVPDLPAHGFSDTPDRVRIDALFAGRHEALDRTLDEPAVIVGNSLGGAMALRYALDRPAKVLGLALLAPGGAPLAAHELDDLKSLFKVESDRDALAFVDRVMVRPGAMRRLYAMGVRAGFGRPEVRALLDAISPDDALSAEEVRALSVPVRVLWGAEERVFPPSSRTFFEAHLPEHGRVEVHRGLGHCAHLDDCDRVVRIVLGWCEEFARLGADQNAPV